MKPIRKLVNLPAAIPMVKAWKMEGKRIVFTNGCFDILHVGHVNCLELAGSFGDKLIVGVNSDESVKRLKGKNRPIHSAMERARVLASLEIVDLLIVFNENTPNLLIHELLPDVLVKGGDYVPHEIVGADIVEKNGGEIHIVPYLPNYSTSQIIKRMKSNE